MTDSKSTTYAQIRESESLPGPYDIPDQPRKRRKPAVKFWDTPEGQEITERTEKLFGKFEKEM